MRTLRAFTFVSTAFLATTLLAGATDWPCWRGPNGLGVSAERNLPDRWSRDSNVVWKAELPGKGASSPVVVGPRIYLTTQTADTAMHLLCLDRDSGRILWQRQVAEGKERANSIHNMATPTPVSDGERVWVRFGTGVLACMDREGQVVWSRELGKEYGSYNANHGMGTSPMLLDGRLFVVVMHQGPSYLLALEAKTGRNLWKQERNLEPKDEAQDSYSSPIFVRAGRRIQMVVAGAEAVDAYDPATGDSLWRLGGLKVPHAYGRTIAGPTAFEDTIIAVASGFQNRGYTLAVSANGAGQSRERLWTLERYSPDCPTPVAYGGLVYCLRDDGNASCLDLKTGKVHWQERLFSENVKVSPVAADEKIYFISGQGNCHVIRAGPSFEILATNELREATLSSPAISDGKLFVRTEGGLYCLGKK